MRIVKSNKSVTASSKTGVVYDKDGLKLTLTEKYNDFTQQNRDDVIGYIENTTGEPIDLTDYGHEQIVEPGKTELHPTEKDFFLINYILEMDQTPLTKEQVKKLWDTAPMYIVWDDGSDSMCQDNDYSLEEILKYVDQGYCVYVDGDYTDVNSCDNITGSTRRNNMRIVKSSKDVKACKNPSTNEQALTHIRAAIDVLGKSGNKDDITKDSIANLSVVMFDLMGNKEK